jgi:hypothetical protein
MKVWVEFHIELEFLNKMPNPDILESPDLR